MKTDFYAGAKLGLLGGGQLGRMLIQAGIDWDIRFSVLDPDPYAPCHALANFTAGSLTDYDTIMRFGADCDLITIELENVNTLALEALERTGKKIFPQPRVIEIIRDKRRQKQFFIDKKIPTAPFVSVENRREAMERASFLPAMNKLAISGYDGRGVQPLVHRDDLKNAFDAPGLLEKWVDVDKEIAVIIARNEQGDTVAYPPVEMSFYAKKNILDYVLAPAQISSSLEQYAVDIADKVIRELSMTGILAVEMFVDRTGKLLVNELAPRPHNCGHHTLEACPTSQYEQHLRAIFSLPMGNVSAHSPCAMVNLLGRAFHEGKALYRGVQEVLSMAGVHVHIYGKRMTRPFRKMGHVTILDENVERLTEKMNFVRNKLNVMT